MSATGEIRLRFCHSAQALLLAYDDARVLPGDGCVFGWFGGGPIRTAVRAFGGRHIGTHRRRQMCRCPTCCPTTIFRKTSGRNRDAVRSVRSRPAAGRAAIRIGRSSRPRHGAKRRSAIGSMRRFAGTGSMHVRFCAASRARARSLGRLFARLSSSSTVLFPGRRQYASRFPEHARCEKWNGVLAGPGRGRDTRIRWSGSFCSAISAGRETSSEFTFDDPAISAGIGVSGLDGLIRLDAPVRCRAGTRMRGGSTCTWTA